METAAFFACCAAVIIANRFFSYLEEKARVDLARWGAEHGCAVKYSSKTGEK